MSVLVVAENWNGNFKKSTYEAVSYANEIAKQLGTNTTAVSIGSVSNDTLQTLGKYGASKVINITHEKLVHFNAQACASVIADVAKKEGSEVLVLSNTWNGKSCAPRVAVKLQAGLVSDAIALPSSISPFTIRKKIFSGKAFASVEVKTTTKILALAPNSFHLSESAVTVSIENFTPVLSDSDFVVQHKELKKAGGAVSITEAEVVVSGGRGLKGPENWGMLEELAKVLGAGTACSKPVADMDWRPHHEHVGQTGIAIAPNLYIAIGISGAIQHLAGVNSSKVMVAINNDPEAPFFKAADYGIVGDAFEVVPKLIEAFKEYKSSLN
jgi:electron transfer flavoprotein alpha subunit